MFKKILSALIISAMAVSFTACGNGGDTKQASQTSQQSEQSQAETKAETGADATTAQASGDKTNQNPDDAQSAAEAKAEPTVAGTLYQLNLKDSEQPVITGLRLTGNRVGDSDGINAKTAGTENIRSVFALNEWIELYPETTAENGVTAYIIRHRDRSLYTEKFFDNVYGDGVHTELQKPEDDTQPWGSFYVNPDDSSAGYFDIVFATGAKPVAVVTVGLFDEAELDGKTDAELEKLTEGEITAEASTTEPEA